MTEQLKVLWNLAFGDDWEFIDLFFGTAYSPDHCAFLTENRQVTAALYWLDCEFSGQKQAYLYAVATHPDHRGKGLCRKLMSKTHDILRQQGYTAALLHPADESLREMYRKMGYRDCGSVSEFSCTAGDPVPLRKIDAREYGRLRREFLPEDGAVQEGVSLEYLASYTRLYTGEGFLLAGTGTPEGFQCMELLGDRDAAPGILASLGHDRGRFRCPGKDIPFTMFLPLAEDAQAPEYLGLVFD